MDCHAAPHEGLTLLKGSAPTMLRLYQRLFCGAGPLRRSVIPRMQFRQIALAKSTSSARDPTRAGPPTNRLYGVECAGC